MMSQQKTGINLLPWRKMERDRARKKINVLVGSITVSLMVVIIYFYVNQLTQHKVVRNSTVKTVEQDLYRKQLKNFKDQFKKNTAKFGQQSLDSLHFIGLLKDGSKTWALISQSNGLVSNVILGDYLGKEHGLVRQIKEDVIEIEKTVWSKRRLKKKWIVLPLRTQNQVPQK